MIPHVSDNMQCVSYYVWHISLSITPSKSNHTAADGKTLFLFVTEQYSIMCVRAPSSLSIHLLMDTEVASVSWQL